MKRIILVFFVSLFTQGLLAQYTGGNGGGDGKAAMASEYISENREVYYGGKGRGDSVSSLLSHTFTPPAVEVYAGGKGRGDNTISALTNTFNPTPFEVYLGGKGGGDNAQEVLGTVFNPLPLEVYTGGKGRGDRAISISNVPITANVIEVYSGGKGRGDHVFAASGLQIFSGALEAYAGGKGRGDAQVGNSNRRLSNTFINNGNWETTANWSEGVLPTSSETAYIDANPSIKSTGQVVKNLEVFPNRKIVGPLSISVSGYVTNEGAVEAPIALNGSAKQTIKGGTFRNITCSNSDSVVLDPSDTVYLDGTVHLVNGTLFTSDNLVLKASSSTQYGIVYGNGTLSGNLTVQKLLSSMDDGWRQVSLPVNTAIKSLVGIDKLFSSHTPSNEINVYKWDASSSGSVANGWVASGSTEGNSQAYALYSSSATGGRHDLTDSIWSITGGYFGGTYTQTLHNTVDPNGSGTLATGWNLVPNPYACNLSVSGLFGLGGFPSSYKAIHVWDAVGSSKQYIAICSSGVTMQQYNNTGVTNGSGALAPFQAFWVKASSSATLSFTRSITVTSTVSTHFLKKAPETLRIDVWNKDSLWDQSVIYLQEGTTSKFNGEYDAYKLFSMDARVPSIYSLTDVDPMSIKALSDTFTSLSIPLGVRNPGASTLKFAANIQEFNPTYSVVLEDRKLGTFTDLKAGSYSAAVEEKTDNRFFLHVSKTVLHVASMDQDYQPSISGDGKTAYIYVPASFSNKAFSCSIINMEGKVIRTESRDFQSGQNSVSLADLAPGVYLVRIQNSVYQLSKPVIKQ